MTVTATNPGVSTASNSVTSSALLTGLAPTFGTPTRTADGYTVTITNYSGLYSYFGIADNGGSVSVSGGDGHRVGLGPRRHLDADADVLAGRLHR